MEEFLSLVKCISVPALQWIVCGVLAFILIIATKMINDKTMWDLTWGDLLVAFAFSILGHFGLACAGFFFIVSICVFVSESKILNKKLFK